MKLKGLDHIAISVKDVKKSAAWYCEVLGMERRHKEAWGDEPAMVCAGDTCVALFPPRGGKDPSEDTSTAYRHFAFAADKSGFENAQKELRERGIEFEFQDHGITKSIYFKDPDGHELEITTHEV
jgi:catechol 2,3-dioxygenase-like lactoylglutathione lyase family enzyme